MTDLNWWIPDQTVAVFTNGGVTETVNLDENGECFVPASLLSNVGVLDVSVYCGIRVTSSVAKVNIHKTLPVDDE